MHEMENKIKINKLEYLNVENDKEFEFEDFCTYFK